MGTPPYLVRLQLKEGAASGDRLQLRAKFFRYNVRRRNASIAPKKQQVAKSAV